MQEGEELKGRGIRIKITQCQQHSKSMKLPLLTKRLNPLQKYINTYRQKSISTQLSHSKPLHNSTAISHHQLFQRKFTPDPNSTSLLANKCYVKYQPLNQWKRQQKILALQKIQQKYSNLKNNIKSDKQPFTSKYTYPITSNHTKTNRQLNKYKIQVTVDQIQKQLKKQILIQNGQKYFADLYMIKKDRDKLRQSVKKNKQLLQNTLSQKRKQHQLFLIQKKTKQAQQRKDKMLKYKGLHWNVYYEMLALSKNQKERLKGCKSSFVEIYGTD